MPTLTRAANCRHSPARQWVAILLPLCSSSSFIGRHIVDRRPCRSTNPFEQLYCANFFVGPADLTCPILRQYFAAKSNLESSEARFSSSTCNNELAQPWREAGVIAFVSYQILFVGPFFGFASAYRDLAARTCGKRSSFPISGASYLCSRITNERMHGGG